VAKRVLALHAIESVFKVRRSFSLSRAEAMDKIATHDPAILEADALIEKNAQILEQVRKDLSQQYTHFMSRLVKERLGMREGDGSSVFKHLDRGI
jgi:hypothetical protein